MTKPIPDYLGPFVARPFAFAMELPKRGGAAAWGRFLVSTSDEAQRLVEAEIKRWSAIMKELGVGKR